MKRLIAILLSCAMFLAGCSMAKPTDHTASSDPTTEADAAPSESETTQDNHNDAIQFEGLNDPQLLPYLEETIYEDLVAQLNSQDYFVENVQAIYISKEYLEEFAYNSQANIYFGYTLAELDTYFEDTKYVFTLDDDGQTSVKPFEAYDDTYDRVIKNVATGAGIILVCVTVSTLTGGVAPAVSLIFAASAKTGTAVALSSGAFGALTAGVVKGAQTGDLEETLKAAALAGSQGFKWGAISGGFGGGASQMMALKGATLNGLTMNQAAQIQRESSLPLSFIKNFHSMDEYNVYKSANLQLAKVNGKWAYTQTIDWEKIDYAGRTNIERVMERLSPMDATGNPFELHHIGQEANSPLAILTNSQHKGNFGILHANPGGSASLIDRTAFIAEKQEFWKAMLDMAGLVP